MPTLGPPAPPPPPPPVPPVAPLERRRERVLPGRRRVRPGPQNAEAVVQPLRDRRGTERSETSGGELGRKREPVEAEADARDVHGVLLVEREAGRRRVGALDEEPDRLVAQELLGREPPLGIRNLERRNAEDDLALRAQRLAA